MPLKNKNLINTNFKGRNMEQRESTAIENLGTTERPSATAKRKWDKWKIIAIINSVVLIGAIILATIVLSKQKSDIWDIWLDVYKLKTNAETSDDMYSPKPLDLKITELQHLNGALTIKVIKVEPYMDEQKFTFGILNTSSVTMENINLKISSENAEKDVSISNMILPGTMVKTSAVLPKSIYDTDVKIRYAGSGLRYREM